MTATSSDQLAVQAFDRLGSGDVARAGGKGANLGRLTADGFPVPPGFVVLAGAYEAFREQTHLDRRLHDLLDGVDIDDPDELQATAAQATAAVIATPIPDWLAEAIAGAYLGLMAPDSSGAVAVRSSATAEDTASASFAGMNESFLNVRGAEETVTAVKQCWSSLFGARTLYYRAQRGLDLAGMAIAVVVQRQIASERSGVMFTVDPATGDRDRLVIEGAFGLGESVVSGQVSPDRYVVDKPGRTIVVRSVHKKELTIEPRTSGGTQTRALHAEEASRPALTDDEVLALADIGMRIEDSYGAPQDTEWAIDGDGTVWMLQSRPITTLSAPRPAAVSHGDLEVTPAPTAPDVLVRGLGAAPGLASGPVRKLASIEQAHLLAPGEVLVTHMTAPDWVPLMRTAAAVVTDSGGMTCHAAIVSRELGIPCVVGTANATETLRDGELVTVDATEGTVRAGATPVAEHPAPPVPGLASESASPVTGTRLLVNLSEPSQARAAAALDVDGVGLLRAELMLVEALGGAHPRALLAQGGGEEFVARMADGLTTFAEAFTPRPVTYRTTDLRSNEFSGLEGGAAFEPTEANPMIGYRGALRYVRDPEVFTLELQALGRVWDRGHRNLHVMLPFVRTEPELRRCRKLIADAGLWERPGFELWVMAEVPSVLFNLERYAALGITGISIGSNDLTQLLLGADRDSELLADTFDERDPAVCDYLRQLIPRARRAGLRTSICGQAPSVHPEYAQLLVDAGIDAISVSPDAVARTRRAIAAAEQLRLLRCAGRCADDHATSSTHPHLYP